MMPKIYYTGITPPPPKAEKEVELVHCPTINVKFNSAAEPLEISEILNTSPNILLLSKNAVRGLRKWLASYHLDSSYFQGQKFWTVGNASQTFLESELNIHSCHPVEMTGLGLIKELQKQNVDIVLLIGAREPRQSFINGLKECAINFYHFPVYQTKLIENRELKRVFKNRSNEWLLFSSPSTVQGFLHTLELTSLSMVKAKVLSIGPTTSEAVREAGGNIFFESPGQDLTRLFQDIASLAISHEQS